MTPTTGAPAARITLPRSLVDVGVFTVPYFVRAGVA